jgi:hypothetical protein
MFLLPKCASACKKFLGSRVGQVSLGITLALFIAFSLASQLNFFSADFVSENNIPPLSLSVPVAQAAQCSSTDYNCLACQGVSCTSFCSGSTYYYSGYCSYGSCYYSSTSMSSRTRYTALGSSCGVYGSSSETQYYCPITGSWSGSYSLTSAPSVTTRTRYAAATSACGTYGSYSETQTCLSGGSFDGTYTLTSPASVTTRTRYAAATSACGTYGSNSQTQSCLPGGSFDGTYTLTSPPSAATRTM